MTGRADAAATPHEGLIALVRRVGRGIRWYVETLMGDRAYATYLAHHCQQHPDELALTERQFWRERMDDQDRNPGARCC
ncbi:YbdD/YjiX family protein [Microbacterium sp. zg-Y818]|uniref:YbdD/YjiX family protein n=1 Tax=unclassified Microbacterium TaxID=2609290 RepID=UPI00214BB69E|nr:MULTISPECIES: YbdD/YjiX family protein [unclassified Microbacterium]MCR2802037.1 YbdD/YjiX family protein [Microbacterium sp. zg.Y818]WIM22589.1 YbdD/YjiX family protein [Microbacterium sp. zg-Y818]